MPNPNWIKGCRTPNPKGAPQKQDSLTFLMKQYLKGVDPNLKKSYAEIFVRRVYQKAIEGDPACTKLIWNYTEGMPKQNIDMNANVSQVEIPPEKAEAIKKALDGLR